MLVVDSNKQILGSLNKTFGHVAAGDFIRIRALSYDDRGMLKSDPAYIMSHKIQQSELKIPVIEVERRVSIDELDVENYHRLNGSSSRQSDVAVIAANDREFRKLIEAGGQIDSYKDAQNMRTVARVRLKVMMVDLETYEKIFDMDEFTPH